MLARARLGDHAPLPHSQRQKRLAERVIDFVRAGVVEVLALQVNLRPATFLAQPRGMIQRRRPADVVSQ